MNTATKNQISLMDQETFVVKAIWIIYFESYTDWVAANNFEEALSYFTTCAQRKIVKMEKTNDKITYKY